jgi:hypothetical protein
MKHLEYFGQPNGERAIEYLKSNVRSNVEHIFYRVKRVFGYGNVIYRGILKNTGRLYRLFAGACSVDMGVGTEACKTGGWSVIGAVRPFPPSREKGRIERAKSPVKRHTSGRLWKYFVR